MYIKGAFHCDLTMKFTVDLHKNSNSIALFRKLPQNHFVFFTLQQLIDSHMTPANS